MKRLTEKQIEKLAAYMNCDIEQATKYFTQADTIVKTLDKFKKKREGVCEWDICGAIAAYEEAKAMLKSSKKDDDLFEVEFWADDLTDEWDRIKDDKEVKELLKLIQK